MLACLKKPQQPALLVQACRIRDARLGSQMSSMGRTIDQFFWRRWVPEGSATWPQGVLLEAAWLA
jgi:hypothetical protein